MLFSFIFAASKTSPIVKGVVIMLKFLVIGFLLAIGWGIGTCIINEINHSIMSRLINTTWYRRLTNRHIEEDEECHERKIGFI